MSLKKILASKWFKLAITICIMILFAVYVYRNRNTLEPLQYLKFKDMLMLLFITILSFVPMAFQFKLFLEAFGLKLKTRQWFGLTLLNSFYNLFLPASTGIMVRAFYLKDKHSLSYTRYACLMAGSLLYVFLVSAATSLMLLLYQYLVKRMYYPKLMILSVLALILSVAFLWFFSFSNVSINTESARYKILGKLRLLYEGMFQFREHKNLIKWVLLTQFVYTILTGVKLYLAFSFLDAKIDVATVVAAQALSVFTLFIQLTPGNIGIREGIIGGLNSLTGVPMATSILAAGIDRVFNTVVIIVLGLAANYLLLKKNKSRSNDVELLG